MQKCKSLFQGKARPRLQNVTLTLLSSSSNEKREDIFHILITNAALKTKRARNSPTFLRDKQRYLQHFPFRTNNGFFYFFVVKYVDIEVDLSLDALADRERTPPELSYSLSSDQHTMRRSSLFRQFFKIFVCETSEEKKPFSGQQRSPPLSSCLPVSIEAMTYDRRRDERKNFGRRSIKSGFFTLTLRPWPHMLLLRAKTLFWAPSKKGKLMCLCVCVAFCVFLSLRSVGCGTIRTDRCEYSFGKGE